MVIKNLKKLEQILSHDKLRDLEIGASFHQRYSNISFKILKLNENEITIGTYQDKSSADNYANAERLKELTKELFHRFLSNLEINVRPEPFLQPPTELVTPEWIRDKMDREGVKIKDIIGITGMDKTNLSAWVNGLRPMTRPVKAMFYFYFYYQTKENQDITKGGKKNEYAH